MSSALWQKPDRGIQINKAHPLAKGLVGCWVMNEGTGDKVFDLSGNGNHGTIVGPEWCPNGLDFVKTNSDYVNIPYAAIYSLPENDNDFTIIQYVNPDSLTTGSVFDASFTFGGTDDLIIYPNQATLGSGIRIYWRALSGNIMYETGQDRSGEWFMVGLTSIGGNNHKLYAEGLQVGSSAESDAEGPFNSCRIGGWADGTQYYDGKVGYTLCYNRALSAEEIAWISREPYTMFEQPVSPGLLYYEAVAAEANPYWYYQMLRGRNE